jgi:MFS family permease
MSKKVSDFRFILKTSIAAFGTYFCMYAFRKPFTVATFDNLSFWGIDYKILLILAQVLGYTLSKFLGIKIISELKSSKRTLYLIGFILISELALLGFALTPAPYNILFLFINGLPLGMIWGIVFSYIEGRKTTELLGVILCSSFIVSSGAAKSVGLFVLKVLGCNEFWMPFVSGLIFIIPLILFSLYLEKIPNPTDEDLQLKSKRKPLGKKERISLFSQFAFPLTTIIIFYAMLTAMREFRDNFARELWDALGYKESISIYMYSEIPIAISVLVILGVLGSMKNNYKAFINYHLVLFLGSLLIGVATFLFQKNMITPLPWMIASGFGMYVCYIPFNGLFFDRMIATYKISGNTGFLIYIADAFGYLGSILVLFFKNFGNKNISLLNFFTTCIYLLSFIGLLTTVLSYNYFRRKFKKTIKISVASSYS